MDKARRRHVPAFGEWNYYSSSSPSSPEEPRSGAVTAAAGESWWYAAHAPEPDACSDAWFRYSPPPRRAPAPKKLRRTGPGVVAQNPCYDDGCGGNRSVVPATEARARASGGAGAARAPAKGARRVVRPVDADLYGVPPPDDTAFSRRPIRKRAARSLWMGCLGGFNCVA